MTVLDVDIKQNVLLEPKNSQQRPIKIKDLIKSSKSKRKALKKKGKMQIFQKSSGHEEKEEKVGLTTGRESYGQLNTKEKVPSDNLRRIILLQNTILTAKKAKREKSKPFFINTRRSSFPQFFNKVE